MTFQSHRILSTLATCFLTTSLFFPQLISRPIAPAAEPVGEVDLQHTGQAQASNSHRRALLTQRICDAYGVSTQFAGRIVKAAHDIGIKERVDPVLLLALVGVESSFKPQARNPSGAIGLTQTIPRWHPEKIAAIKAAGKSPLDPEANLAMGARILAEYTQLSGGNRMQALQRYNGALNDRQQRYAQRVMGVYRQLSHELPPPANPVLLAMADTQPVNH